MSATGELYELGTTYQPDEASLPLSVDDLFSLEAALEDAGETPRRIAGDRYVVEPMPEAWSEPARSRGRGT
jgi:hydroxyacylglutathione hydrolase